MEQVPEEVAEIAIKYEFHWSSKSFQKDVLDLYRGIKTELVKQMKFKDAALKIEVSVFFKDIDHFEGNDYFRNYPKIENKLRKQKLRLEIYVI